MGKQQRKRFWKKKKKKLKIITRLWTFLKNCFFSDKTDLESSSVAPKSQEWERWFPNARDVFEQYAVCFSLIATMQSGKTLSYSRCNKRQLSYHMREDFGNMKLLWSISFFKISRTALSKSQAVYTISWYNY